MKANRHGLLKAIAFISAVISMFSCSSCDNEPVLKPSVTISAPENLGASSATLVASVIPNLDNTTVSFEYKTDNSAWKSTSLPTKFSGSSAVKVTLDVSDLEASTQYSFRVSAINASGSATSSISTFTTAGLPKPVIKIKTAESVKISSATLIASVIPNLSNTTISFEYQTANSAWQTKTLTTSFSGSDSLKITFDLSDLQANTLYNFRVRASSKAGETISATSTFTTYAVSDYDGNYYHTVTIGGQTWLKENLKTTHFTNGDAIPSVKDLAVWGNLTSGAYCKFNNNDSIANIYGYLYNFYVASDTRSLVNGYHVPVTQEWNTLYNKLYTAPLEVMNIVESLIETGKVHWTNPIRMGSNSTGFTALPNGSVNVDKDTKTGSFNSLGETATFWSSDPSNGYGSANIINQRDYQLMFFGQWFKTDGFGIRLLKN